MYISDDNIKYNFVFKIKFIWYNFKWCSQKIENIEFIGDYNERENIFWIIVKKEWRKNKNE